MESGEERRHCLDRFREKASGQPKVTFELSPEGNMGVGHMGIWGKSVLGRGNIKCRDP